MVNDHALKVLIAFSFSSSFLCKTENYVFFKFLKGCFFFFFFFLSIVHVCMSCIEERERERERECCLDEISGILF